MKSTMSALTSYASDLWLTPESKVSNSSVQNFSSIEEIITVARLGKMFILVDDEERENEGDLIIAAEFVTPSIINFMMSHGKGMICLTLDEEITKKLKLDLQPRRNVNNNYTAFTTTIDARFGITTGISAQDRAITIQTAIASDSTEQDIITPGHVFPIIANKNGVLERPGHTEASIDIAKLAGLTPAAVVCEILDEEGKAARRKFLLEFAYRYNLLIGTIDSLIKYRRNNVSF